MSPDDAAGRLVVEFVTHFLHLSHTVNTKLQNATNGFIRCFNYIDLHRNQMKLNWMYSFSEKSNIRYVRVRRTQANSVQSKSLQISRQVSFSMYVPPNVFRLPTRTTRHARANWSTVELTLDYRDPLSCCDTELDGEIHDWYVAATSKIPRLKCSLSSHSSIEFFVSLSTVSLEWPLRSIKILPPCNVCGRRRESSYPHRCRQCLLQSYRWVDGRGSKLRSCERAPHLR